jgi:hypothetical protein
LLGWLASLGQLLTASFLRSRSQQLDQTAPPHPPHYRLADAAAPRTLKTACGPVRYCRAYWTPRHGPGPGLHPLDIELGLTRDAYTPLIIGWFCRLATGLSFRLASQWGGMFLSVAPPPPSAIEEWVLGLGQPAYQWHQQGPVPSDDGEVLVIECDGKAIPTATEEELAKRRGPRAAHAKACSCGCQRHRSRQQRHQRGPRRRRQRGDKSKNGRSATLVVMYTLRRGADGRLHGPVNKKVYATFSARRIAVQWARAQATRRGFASPTDKTVQIVVDGESCLEQYLRALFPRAVITLDIRHAQERLWRVGRLFAAQGSEALAAWVKPWSELLSAGKGAELVKQLRQTAEACRGPGSKRKRTTIAKVVAYLDKRQSLMQYGDWREREWVVASGQVEGACRQVIGERLDCSGMRWTVAKAEAVLQLRCIEINGEWEAFFAWAEQRRAAALAQGEVVQIRSQEPTQLPETLTASARRRQRRKHQGKKEKRGAQTTRAA